MSKTFEEFRAFLLEHFPDGDAEISEDKEIIISTGMRIQNDAGILKVVPIEEQPIPGKIINLYAHPKFQAAHHDKLVEIPPPDFPKGAI